MPALAVLTLAACGNSTKGNGDASTDDTLEIINDIVNETVDNEEDCIDDTNILPDDASFLAEDKKTGMKAYLVKISEMHDGEGEAISQLWLTDRTGKTKCMFTTSTEWQQMDWETPKKYPLTSIMAVEGVDFIYNKAEKKSYLVIGGCPDSRNMFIYLMPASLDATEALFLRCPDGYFGFDEETQHIIGGSYAYHEEGGRYGIRLEMDFNGKILDKTIVEDEEY